MEAYDCNPGLMRLKQEDCHKLKESLDNRLSPRPAKVIQQYLLYNNNFKKDIPTFQS